MKTAEGSAFPTRKPYHPPTLRIYGDMAAITGAQGLLGMDDGGTMTLQKTGIMA